MKLAERNSNKIRREGANGQRDAVSWYEKSAIIRKNKIHFFVYHGVCYSLNAPDSSHAISIHSHLSLITWLKSKFMDNCLVFWNPQYDWKGRTVFLKRSSWIWLIWEYPGVVHVTEVKRILQKLLRQFVCSLHFIYIPIFYCFLRRWDVCIRMRHSLLWVWCFETRAKKWDEGLTALDQAENHRWQAALTDTNTL